MHRLQVCCTHLSLLQVLLQVMLQVLLQVSLEVKFGAGVGTAAAHTGIFICV